jgi:hypothetical protein
MPSESDILILIVTGGSAAGMMCREPVLSLLPIRLDKQGRNG